MMETFVLKYGYFAVFVGTLVEGEVFILLGGFLAHRGYLNLANVVAVATLGAYAGDIMYFILGRFYGRALLKKNRRAARMLPWLERFMRKYHVLWVFAVRYLWGMRWLAAVLAGSSKVKLSRYSVVDLAACLVWAVVVGLLGFGAGEALEQWLGDLKRYEVVVLLFLILAGIAYGLLAHLEERRLGRRLSNEEPAHRT